VLRTFGIGVLLAIASGCSSETKREPTELRPALIAEASEIGQVLAGRSFATDGRREVEWFCPDGTWGRYLQAIDPMQWNGRWRIVQNGDAIPLLCIDNAVELYGAKRKGEVCRRIAVQKNPSQILVTRLEAPERLPMLLYRPDPKPASCERD
jgi:hypothetical protein